MRRIQLPLTMILSSLLITTGCSTVPGSTEQSQIDEFEKLIEHTLVELYAKNIDIEKQADNAIGYIVLTGTVTKVPVFGAGSGYGVAVDNVTGEKTYLKTRRVDIGAGWGIRSSRTVIFFSDASKFEEFRRGKWTLNLGAEATAKVGDVGGNGSTDGSGILASKGYKQYLILDSGLSVTFTSTLTRISPFELVEQK